MSNLENKRTDESRTSLSLLADQALSLAKVRGLAFNIPDEEHQWIPGHVEELLKGAHAVQRLIHDKLEAQEDEDVQTILNAHVAATFLTSMALELTRIKEKASA